MLKDTKDEKEEEENKKRINKKDDRLHNEAASLRLGDEYEAETKEGRI